MRYDFYQLTRDPPEQVVPLLAAKIVGHMQRAVVLSGDRSQLERISGALWSQQPESFLAHAIAGDDGIDPAVQPILLSGDIGAANGAANLIVADGIWRPPGTEFSRLFHLFMPDRVEEARAAWRSLGNEENADRHFWEQSGGRWVERG